MTRTAISPRFAIKTFLNTRLLYAPMVEFAELPPPPESRFGPVRLVAETGSTNADLLARAIAGEPEGSVLVTDHQRTGRGRQQRVWHDEPGSSLLVSILLRPPAEVAPLLPLVAGLAATDAVAALADTEHQVGLKWPNDVLVPSLGERKLAGILAEAATSAAGLAVVVGMGMNLRSLTPPPVEIERRVVTLTEIIGAAVDRDLVLGRYLEAFDRWLLALESGEPVLEPYRERCLTLGRVVRFVSVDTEHHGTAVEVTDRGTLVLETMAGERVELNAGDAHHV